MPRYGVTVRLAELVQPNPGFLLQWAQPLNLLVAFDLHILTGTVGASFDPGVSFLHLRQNFVATGLLLVHASP